MQQMLANIFGGEMGVMVASLCVAIGLTDIAISHFFLKKRAFGADAEMAKRARPAYYMLLGSGVAIAAIGFYGFDLRFGFL